MMIGGAAGDGDPLSGRMGALSALQGLHPNPEMVGTNTGKGKEERLPQWSQQETRDLIAIRADLERDFNVVRRNKTLWEAVAGKMRERGFRRSPEQCKCKWKNLVNRYKVRSFLSCLVSLVKRFGGYQKRLDFD